MNKPTPGPWTRVNLTICTKSDINHPNYRIARVFEAGVETLASTSVGQATANANLIMAAPDLIESCEEMVLAWDHNHIESVKMRSEAIAKMRLAIAKVYGK